MRSRTNGWIYESSRPLSSLDPVECSSARASIMIHPLVRDLIQVGSSVSAHNIPKGFACLLKRPYAAGISRG